VLAALGEQPESVRELLGVMGGLLAVLMLTLGVLATAGEWTHRTVQTTFLFVPRRGKVIAANTRELPRSRLSSARLRSRARSAWPRSPPGPTSRGLGWAPRSR
jgi:hypothetical protein